MNVVLSENTNPEQFQIKKKISLPDSSIGKISAVKLLNEDYVYFGTESGDVYKYGLNEEKVISKIFQSDTKIRVLEKSKDGGKLGIVSGRNIYIYDLKAKSRIRLTDQWSKKEKEERLKNYKYFFPIHLKIVNDKGNSICIVVKRNFIAEKKRMMVEKWNINKKKKKKTKTIDSWPKDLSISPRNKNMAFYLEGKGIQVMNLKDFEIVKTLPKYDVSNLIMSKDVLYVYHTPHLKAVDFKKNKIIAENRIQEIKNISDGVTSSLTVKYFHFLADKGKIVMSSEEKGVIIYNSNSLERMYQITNNSFKYSNFIDFMESGYFIFELKGKMLYGMIE